MKIDIRHRATKDIIFSNDQEDNSIKKTLELAINSNSDLSGSDLRGSDLICSHSTVKNSLQPIFI